MIRRNDGKMITMRGWLSLLLLSGCGATANPLTSPYPVDECPDCVGWNTPREPFHIFGNVYFVGTEGLSAILLTSSEGHVLIDGGLPNTAPLIIENIRSLGFDIADVEVILNSHAHYDHAGGIAALRRASGARVLATVPSASVMESGGSSPDDPQGDLLFDYPATGPVERIEDGQIVAVGPTSLTAHLTPGHTPGGTSWTWRTCEETRCIDFAYADSMTPVSEDGFRFSDSPSILANFERGIAAIERLPCDVLITPHPSASEFWQRWQRGIDGLVDTSACRQYAARVSRQLSNRLASEASP